MLFLIHLIGGYYCVTQLDKSSDTLSKLVMSVFFGWIFIIIYVIQKCMESDTSSDVNRAKQDSYAKPVYTDAKVYTTESYTSNDNYVPLDRYSDCEDDDPGPGWSYEDLCDYYGCEEDNWPCD